MAQKAKLPEAPFLPPAIYNKRNEEDKLPPEEMSVEKSYDRAVSLADQGY